MYMYNRSCAASSPGPLVDHFRPQERLPKSHARPRGEDGRSALTWSPKECWSEGLGLLGVQMRTGVPWDNDGKLIRRVG